MSNNFQKIIISRTDAIGDVILTLPMCGLIKKYYPNVKIIFLGRSYTQAIIEHCEHVDEFINADTLLQLPEKEAVAQYGSTDSGASLGDILGAALKGEDDK